MKRIVYKDKIAFNLPDHWVAEEDSGIGVFFEQGEEVSTLRVELLVAKSPKPVDKNTPFEMLQAISTGDESVEELGNGVFYKTHLSEFVEKDQEIIIHYWYIANAVNPDIGQLVTFSFTTLSSNRNDPETLQIVGMLDKEIRGSQFID